MNKDGRISSEDVGAVEQSREHLEARNLEKEFEALKETITAIIWGPKGFRDPHVDGYVFNRVTGNQSALLGQVDAHLWELEGQPKQDSEDEREEQLREEEEREREEEEAGVVCERLDLDFNK